MKDDLFRYTSLPLAKHQLLIFVFRRSCHVYTHQICKLVDAEIVRPFSLLIQLVVYSYVVDISLKDLTTYFIFPFIVVGFI